jgi:vancomycin permeability regulator SanA
MEPSIAAADNSVGRGVPALVTVLLVLVGVLALYAILLSRYGLGARLQPADVAIVFGSQVRPDGTPSPRLVARLETAAKLRRSRLVRTWFVSGGISREGHDESRVMRDWLVAHGVPDSAIVRDSLGVKSQLTAEHAATWMREHGVTRANVITQYFHIARACMACDRAGIDVVGARAPRWYEPRDVYSLAREMVALPVYAFRGR